MSIQKKWGLLFGYSLFRVEKKIPFSRSRAVCLGPYLTKHTRMIINRYLKCTMHMWRSSKYLLYLDEPNHFWFYVIEILRMIMINMSIYREVFSYVCNKENFVIIIIKPPKRSLHFFSINNNLKKKYA
jgi:hypothetical protein